MATSLGDWADRGRYFILRLTQLIVRLDSRLGVLRYKIAPKCLLPGPFGHSGVGGNPGVERTVRSYNLPFTYPCQLGDWEGSLGTPPIVARGSRRMVPNVLPGWGCYGGVSSRNAPVPGWDVVLGSPLGRDISLPCHLCSHFARTATIWLSGRQTCLPGWISLETRR